MAAEAETGAPSVSRLLHCNLGSLVRGSMRASLGPEQQRHERPALGLQLAHAHETPFPGPVADQRTVLDVDLAKRVPFRSPFPASV